MEKIRGTSERRTKKRIERGGGETQTRDERDRVKEKKEKEEKKNNSLRLEVFVNVV